MSVSAAVTTLVIDSYNLDRAALWTFVKNDAFCKEVKRSEHHYKILASLLFHLRIKVYGMLEVC